MSPLSYLLHTAHPHTRTHYSHAQPHHALTTRMHSPHACTHHTLAHTTLLHTVMNIFITHIHPHTYCISSHAHTPLHTCHTDVVAPPTHVTPASVANIGPVVGGAIVGVVVLLVMIVVAAIIIWRFVVCTSHILTCWFEHLLAGAPARMSNC